MRMLETLEPLAVDRHAWNRFLDLGLPTKEWEVFRYVRLNDLYAHTYKMPNREKFSFSAREGTLVFVNGSYREELSCPPKGVVALPLSKAMQTYGHFLNHRLTAQLKEEKDPFAALNYALSVDGLFLYLPPKSVSRLEIIHYITKHNHPIVTAPRIHLFAGKSAEARCFVVHHAEHWVNSVIDIALDERASLTLTTILNENETSWHFDALRATLKRESRFTGYAVANGGASSRQDYVVQLLEEEAEASLNGICQLGDRRHHHINVLMEHRAPSCRSLQHFKNVLAGVSRSSFEGKIYVHQVAQKTEAYQKNPNLILNKRASANSKPNLEIFADDVKASHGSTVGQLDLEHLFYFKTRGISHNKAKELLVEGFCQEILNQIEKPYANLCRFT